MLRSMEIDIGASKLADAVRSMRELGAATKITSADIRQAASLQAASTRAAAQQHAAVSAGHSQIRAQAIRNTAEQARAQATLVRAQAGLANALAPAAPRGMNARLAQAQAQLTALQAGGAPASQIEDAAIVVRQRYAALASARKAAEPPDRQQAVMQAILSSRFGAGGVQPLVGRTLAAAGLEGAAAARVAIGLGVIGAAAVAVQGFGRFVAEASERVHQFGIAVLVSGGTGAQIASLRGMGVDPGASAGLRGRLSSDPLAMMAGMRLGIGPVLPRPFGSTNEAVILQKALEGLRALGQGEEQLRLARMLGLETMLDQVNVSREVWNRGQALAKITAEVYSAQAVQNARDLAGEQTNLANAWGALGGSIAKVFIPPVRDLTATGARAAGATAQGLNSPLGQNAIKAYVATILFGLPPFGPLAAAAFLGSQGGSPGNPGGRGDPAATATDRNTQAMTQLLQQLIILNAGLGGGPRSRGVDPERLLRSQMMGADPAERDRRIREVEAQRFGPWAR